MQAERSLGKRSKVLGVTSGLVQTCMCWISPATWASWCRIAHMGEDRFQNSVTSQSCISDCITLIPSIQYYTLWPMKWFVTAQSETGLHSVMYVCSGRILEQKIKDDHVTFLSSGKISSLLFEVKPEEALGIAFDELLSTFCRYK